jgi:dehydrogenase/reductase SDR family protein 7B
MYFQNKSIWLTGASSGIGEAAARELAKRGARLLLSARRVDRLERLKAECSRSGGVVELLPFDQERIGEADAVAREAETLLGRVDIFINNAGIGQSALALDTSIEVTERIFRVNTLGVIALTRALLPHMLERGTGHLVATSSVLGKYGVQRRSTYSASKHALHGYFDSLRCELAETNIAITLICPGWVHTEIERLALRGDGSARGETDTGKDGLTPESFAPKMLSAIAARKREAYIGKKEASAVLLHRFAPNLLTRILAKQPVD